MSREVTTGTVCPGGDKPWGKSLNLLRGGFQ